MELYQERIYTAYLCSNGKSDPQDEPKYISLLLSEHENLPRLKDKWSSAAIDGNDVCYDGKAGNAN